MTCLCKFLTEERAAADGADVRGMVCIFCSKAGLSFREEGTRADAPRTQLAKCRLCSRSMVRDGLCLAHYESQASARLRYSA